MRIANNVTELIGNTPLVRINRVAAGVGATVVREARVLQSRRTASRTDRVGDDRRRRRRPARSSPDTIILEPTSGNTGIGLAMVAAPRAATSAAFVMPETMSRERRLLLKAYGAELILTPGPDGMPGAIRKAEELAAADPRYFIPQQFENPANPEVHRRTTAEEIWRDTDGKVDIFVSGVGTGGTITGVGEVLKARKPGVRIIAVEPDASPVLSGGQHGPHPMQGIGAGFVPEILNTRSTTRWFGSRTTTRSTSRARWPPRKACWSGISSGAAVGRGACQAKRAENTASMIVVVIPSFGERYLSTVLYQHLAA